ncbi:MAG: lipoyl synthase [candidate division WOR-3 bacterium]|nr:lipoyl synthase [candidate division WOR-3 bacterium]
MHRKPDWLKIKLPSGDEFKEVFETLKSYNLSTVCQEARCPNISECWAKKSATIMILGKICTRSCRFCAVTTGNPEGNLDPDEPEKVAQVVKKFGLRYVVITSVNRDDLEDLGSSHYARTIEAIKSMNPETDVEALIPDFDAREEFLQKVIDARPLVIGHNIETVRRLTPFIRDRRCNYEKSLSVLKKIKILNSRILTKSGFMLGLGETETDIIETLKDLRDAGVEIVTIGQYLQPTRSHPQVRKYYTPEEFTKYHRIGKELGIKYVYSGPLVRSSYNAFEVFK